MLITLEKKGSKAEGRRQKVLRETDLFLVFFLGRMSLKMLITHYSLLQSPSQSTYAANPN
ncbi:MAG: hypothetical protein F6K47_17145 [Symploca sp. SIO2E6]|nr:hypothetical protein [Symploca sp. SIO2E6]